MRYFHVPPLVQTFLRITNSFMPERGDARIVRSLSHEALKANYNPNPVGSFTALLPYSDQTVRACIHETKFHKNTKAIDLLASILTYHIQKSMVPVDVIVPVPLSEKRYRSRGYNQVMLVAKVATKDMATECYSALWRTKDTVPQTSLPKQERLTNLTNGFGLVHEKEAEAKLSGKHVLLLDDVTTTGATLSAARAPLAPLSHSFASLTCVALSH